MKLIVINGPNLNKLQLRSKEHYGTLSLQQINNLLQERFPEVEFDFFQANSEGEIIDKLHSSDQYDGIILNAGAYSHYSIAIRDAIELIQTPVVEIHLSNIYSREDFRRKSVISEVCIGVISGFKEYSYVLAVQYFYERLNSSTNSS